MPPVPTELVDKICDLLPFAQLAKFAQSKDNHWAIADRVLRARLRQVISLFIPADKFQSFLEILDTVDGAIVGLIALEIILFHETRNSPLDVKYLDILLPHNSRSMNIAIRFFQSIRYSGFQVVDVPPVTAAGRHTNLVARALGHGPRQADGTRTVVRIFSSRGGPFASLFEATATLLVNAITPDGIYCFYRDLTTSGRGLAQPQSYIINGLQVDTKNDDWGNVCQLYCPRLRRKTVDDEGTLIHRWRVPLGSAYSPEYPTPIVRRDWLEREPLIWSFNMPCTNVRCARGPRSAWRLLRLIWPFK
ncbi:hypothetical protein BKA70DRAFT_1444496 [Coprinopsis sp. MPI-PUGE-AT-0042]|nr:hypothetical protein BKA70DRAFT_1452055 [Coprinopsis sp. MPI-PUGE-AT-0042]KAH6886128.1 hypothetical protein BKA70DRAFT_1444496 [Coprinopsis sp. MPI-PUGE-AT-0042]